MIRAHYILGEIKEADALMEEAGGNKMFLNSVSKLKLKFAPKFKFKPSDPNLKQVIKDSKEVPVLKLEYPSAPNMNYTPKNPLIETLRGGMLTPSL